jgi:hypothetical protein
VGEEEEEGKERGKGVIGRVKGFPLVCVQVVSKHCCLILCLER